MIVGARGTRTITFLVALVMLNACTYSSNTAHSEEPHTVHFSPSPLAAVTPQSKTSAKLPGKTKISPDHPLTSVIDYAKKEQRYLRETVRDFTCRLIKRERLDGILEDNQFIDMSVREEVREGGQVARPFSIALNFVGPTKVAGRKVLFIAGENEGKMLVRNGGRHFDYVMVKVDPWGEAAQAESLVPITESGFNTILNQMISVLVRHAEADPTGENTHVERISGAKLNKRACHVIRITHPKQQPGLEFHQAEVFVDDELHVPVRVDFADWPKREGQPGARIAEYTYTNLKLNVDLPDSLFSQRQLRGSR